MKPGAKSKRASSPTRVREVATKYRATRARARKYTKCRMLTPEELVELGQRMIAARAANNTTLLKQLKRDFTNGFCGEIRA